MDRTRRIHEDELAEIAERKAIRAANKIRRTVMSQFLEDWRQNNFGFLYPEENRILKDLVAQFGRER